MSRRAAPAGEGQGRPRRADLPAYFVRARRAPRVLALGPLHVEMIRWLKANALGLEGARPRAELLAHLVAWCEAEPGRPRVLIAPERGEAGDRDRQMRALAAECLALGWAVLSCGEGYYYGRADVARDWRAARHQATRKLIAQARTVRRLRHAREAEGRREIGDRHFADLRWPPGVQIEIFDGVKA